MELKTAKCDTRWVGDRLAALRMATQLMRAESARVSNLEDPAKAFVEDGRDRLHSYEIWSMDEKPDSIPWTRIRSHALGRKFGAVPKGSRMH
ncbi:hypothetical protein Tdes44962_MAKER03135 [Teratosphaeria destructans]|uniref:Uncharacterized protein n=1 Tax=Teratosphaeria destructans TaxID=418781 RepID=A0A9W7SR40_9PEZI|nr:hypothetical protein Tdes44962_MAKER03135 [Teratosphaeria destructans]